MSICEPFFCSATLAASGVCALCFGEGGGGIGVQVGVEERGVFGEDEMKVVGCVEPGSNGFGANLKNMTPITAAGIEGVVVSSPARRVHGLRNISRCSLHMKVNADSRLKSLRGDID
jgi:hypothetical protein